MKKTTTVSQLKTSLSAYLRQVKTGEEVLITEYGRPIARLLPIENSVSLSEHLQDMEKKGLLKRGEKPLSADFWNLPRPADPQGAVRSAVLSERKESR
ncbi:MAG: type II toxin-antitoxin system prevent-host-death family antitoxin [Nitrospira sp.]|nr:type II toxin-antitoxin system prevent-host-death family antitoxin [Nitrospira sp.]